MPKEPDYDRCYRILGLNSGASLAEIESEYRFLVLMMHPDRLNPGPLQDRANQRLKEINDARDKLKDYFAKHNKAPGAAATRSAPDSPSPPGARCASGSASGSSAASGTASGTASGASSGRREHRESNPRPSDTARTGRKDRDQSQEEQRATDEAEKPASKAERYGPAPLTERPIYSLLRALDKTQLPEPLSAIAVFVLIAVSAIAVFVPLLTFTAITGIPTGPLPVFAMLFTMWFSARYLHAETVIFRILTNPAIENCHLNSSEVTSRCKEALKSMAQTEELSLTDLATCTDAGAKIERARISCSKRFLVFDAGFEANFCFKAQSYGKNRCIVSYWFEIEKRGFWPAPLAVTMNTLDESLRKRLKS